MPVHKKFQMKEHGRMRPEMAKRGKGTVLKKPVKTSAFTAAKATFGRMISSTFEYICRKNGRQPNQIKFLATNIGMEPGQAGQKEYYEEIIRKFVSEAASREYLAILKSRPEKEKKEKHEKTEAKQKKGILEIRSGKHKVVLSGTIKITLEGRKVIVGKKQGNESTVMFYDPKSKQLLYSIHPSTISYLFNLGGASYQIYDYFRGIRTNIHETMVTGINSELIKEYQKYSRIK